MLRITGLRSKAGRSGMRGGAWMVLALPALAPMLLALAEVSYVSVSPSDVTSGTPSTGTVVLTGVAAGATTVNLLSNKASVAKVPASVTVRGGRSNSATFTVLTGSVGCASIKASVGATLPKATLVFVRPGTPPSDTPVRLELPNEAIGLSSTVTGKVTLLLPMQPQPNGVVQLTSSHPSVTVPASITVPLHVPEIPRYVGTATFPITITTTLNSPTCSVITATSAGSQGRGLLKIMPLVQG